MKKLLTIMALVCTTSTPAAAQQWSLEAQAGRMRSALDPASSELQNLVIGARYESFGSALRISAGVPTAVTQSVWGSIAGSHRFAIRTNGLVAGVDLSGTAFLLRDRVERTREIPDVFNQPQVVPAPAQSGYAAAMQAMPLIGYETSRVQAFIRGGVSRYTSEFADQRRNHNVTLAEAQLSIAPTASTAVIPVVRHFITDEDGAFTFAGVTAAAGSSSLSGWASTGRWLNLDDQEMTWAAGATLRVHPRVSFLASGRADALDPLYGTPPQTSWSVGAAVKIGRIATSSVPTPAVFDAGRAVIKLSVSESTSPTPRVAGDFTNWKPQPMRREGDTWVYSAAVAPGVYNFAFVDDNGGWFVPAKYPGRKQDGMGGEVAVMVVR